MPGPQRFGYSPGLSNTTSGKHGRIAIENLAERAQTGGSKLVSEGLQKFKGLGRVLVDAPMSQAKRPWRQLSSS